MEMMALDEPYERFPCNQLRRECYRRKLQVIKSGPHTNATKAGFMRLLREADAKEMPTTELEPVPLEMQFPMPPSRVVSPPTSPMEVMGPVLPTRPPRIDVGESSGAKRQAMNADHMENEKKRQKSDDELQPMSDGSYSSTQPSSVTTSVNEPDPILPDSISKKTDPIVGNTLPRWERLHARLEVVTAKLIELHGRRDDWPPSAVGSNDGSDIEFYELMRRELQRSLIECVTST